MDDCAVSSGGSDYSSMANSTTDLETSATARGALNVSVQQEMRTITDDYNALLRTATEQIRALTAERGALHKQCEELLGVNEDLVRDMAAVLATEAALKRENQKVTQDLIYTYASHSY
jgi:phage-related tail protein